MFCVNTGRMMEVVVASFSLPPTTTIQACLTTRAPLVGNPRSKKENPSQHSILSKPLVSQFPSSHPTHHRFFTFPLAVALGLALVIQPGLHPALGFDWFGGPQSIEKDPVEPFTLYGSIFKKYFIEKIVDGKVVSRKRGFTSTACVNALDADKETPELQGVPAGLKVVIIGEPACSKSEGLTREETCMPSCKSACSRAISQHLVQVTEETGYVLDTNDKGKVVNSCSNQCENECLKPGKTTSFICPFRPSK